MVHYGYPKGFQSIPEMDSQVSPSVQWFDFILSTGLETHKVLNICQFSALTNLGT